MRIGWSLSTRIAPTLAVAVGLIALGATWATVARTIRDATPLSPATRPTAVVWNDLVFSSPAQLRRWLRSRGTTYRQWAHIHPVAAADLEKRPRPKTKPAERRPHTRAARTTVAPAPAVDHRRAAAAVVHTPGGGASAVALLVVFLTLLSGVGCTAGVIIPTFLPAHLPRLARRLFPLRQALGAAAVALFTGLLVALAQV